MEDWKMTEQADGVIVGSAIVKLCETYGEDAASDTEVVEE
jgi:tryptophan synthase alpha subunit